MTIYNENLVFRAMKIEKFKVMDVYLKKNLIFVS